MEEKMTKAFNLTAWEKNLKKTRDMLDAISPSMCFAKWNQVTIHLANGHNHSCHYPKTHPAPLEELKKDPSALHNTPWKKQQRQMMLDGIRPPECSYCWNVEDSSKEDSDRIIKSSLTWAQPYRDKIMDAGSTKNMNPPYVEVSFGNVCNFKCSYCQPDVSSTWMEEIKRHGGYPTHNSFNNLRWIKQEGKMPIPENEHNPYVEAWWRWWPDLVKDLRILRITGGEPLLNKNTIKLMDKLIEEPQPHLSLNINSNLCVPDKNFKNFMERFDKLYYGKQVKSMWIYTSVDNYGEKAEYIRHGLNYELWKKNINYILSTYDEAEIIIMCTFNALSVVGFDKFLQDVYDIKKKYRNEERLVALHLDIPCLKFPFHQNIKILPIQYRSYFETHIKFIEDRLRIRMEDGDGFEEVELTKMKRALDWFEHPTQINDIKRDRIDFYRFFTEHDRRRNTNFLEIFPEMEEFWNSCRRLNDSNI